MKRVKIISGTYGHKPIGAVSVSPISAGGTVLLSDAEAKRLVNLKVAVYTEASKSAVPVDLGEDAPSSGVATPDGDENDEGAGVNPPEDDSGAEGAENGGNAADEHGDEPGDDFNEAELPVYSVEMSLAELKDVFSDCGLTYRVGMSKADMVACLDAHFAADDDGEAPPTLDPEEPVT